MCGIAGYVCTNEYEPKLDMIFPLMGVFMDSRGGDSWGYTDGKQIHKELGELQGSWTPEFTGAKEAAVHTRYGTTGAKTSDNSHPWDFGDGFIGMHNGVVDNHYTLNARYERMFEVDSQSLLMHIKEGRDLQEVEAYGAVVFWRDGIVHLGRFNDGDLAIAQAPWGVVFASREWAISQAFQMAGLKEPPFYNVIQGKLYYIKDGELYISESEKLNVGKRTSKRKWGDFKPAKAAALEPVKSGLRGNCGRKECLTPLVITELWSTGEGLICEACKNALPKPLVTDGCNWCDSTSRELYDTGEGLLCGQCARWASEVDDDWGKSSTGKVIDMTTHGNSADTSGLLSIYDDGYDPFEETTVREFCQRQEIADLPFDDPCMTSCDECHATLLADDTCFVDSTDVEFVVCSNCHGQMVTEMADEEQQEQADDLATRFIAAYNSAEVF